MVANPGRVAYGPVLPEAGDAGDDELRVAREQHVGPEAEALERAGPEVLDEHVGLVAEAAHERRGRRRAFRSRAIVRLPRPPSFHQSVTSSRGSRQPMLRSVSPPSGPLDLDHVGAEVGEVAGARRAGDHSRRVDDPQVRERPRDRCGGRLVGHPKTLKPSGSKARPPSDRISTSGSATFAMISVVRATASLRTVGG